MNDDLVFEEPIVTIGKPSDSSWDYAVKEVIDNASGVGLGVVLSILGIYVLMKNLGIDKAVGYVREMWEKQIDNIENIDENVSDIGRQITKIHDGVSVNARNSQMLNNSFQKIYENQNNILSDVKKMRDNINTIETDIRASKSVIDNLSKKLRG